ncbi:PP2C family protein-serine/threonine phosphatase [Oceanospirillum sediminis]|uniref:Protein phosphatase 2C domain-containing protein n=1 Tax=Oceanospirillum sediminis TaxID=2760088 RepID=A0A839IY00_9GAMM|nr:protein phosphatase 2C domain-containing protein [Oceanospirillum sediminis]MBB1489560.1 protein phosphatase 2C domain-containing protein [Oceanospirillum sediminis]
MSSTAFMDISYLSQVSPSGQAGRKGNQDNFLVIAPSGKAVCLKRREQYHFTHQSWPEGQYRLVVSDGIGGGRHGGEISEELIEALSCVGHFSEQNLLCSFLDDLHHEMQQRWNPDRLKEGATLTLLESQTPNQVQLFHVGDSRLFEISQSRVNCLTLDHSLATRQVVAGAITSEVVWEQAIFDPDRPSSELLCQAFVLGSAMAPESRNFRPTLFPLTEERLPWFLADKADRRLIRLKAGCLYLLATDGFWHLPDSMSCIRQAPELYQNSRDSEDFLQQLFALLKKQTPDRWLGDNCTAIAFQLKPEAV